MKNQHKKIDLYVLWDYACSTNASQTLKVAIEKFCQKFDEPRENIMAYFA